MPILLHLFLNLKLPVIVTFTGIHQMTCPLNRVYALLLSQSQYLLSKVDWLMSHISVVRSDLVDFGID
jgi:hypothetical protein